MRVRGSIYMYTCTCIPRHTHRLTRPPTDSPTHPLTHSLTHQLTHSPTRPLTHSTHSPTNHPDPPHPTHRSSPHWMVGHCWGRWRCSPPHAVHAPSRPPCRRRCVKGSDGPRVRLWCGYGVVMVWLWCGYGVVMVGLAGEWCREGTRCIRFRTFYYSRRIIQRIKSTDTLNGHLKRSLTTYTLNRNTQRSLTTETPSTETLNGHP